MNSPSPPQEAEQIRGNSKSPASPKPLHYPSPSNIPILVEQNDPMFNDPPLGVGTPASFQSYPQHAQESGAHPTSSYYTEQQQQQQNQTQTQQQQNLTSNYQYGGAQGAVGAAPAAYSQPTAYSGGQSQDTSSIHNFASQHQAPPQFSSEAKSPPAQDNRSTYPSSYDSNSYSALQTQTQNQPQAQPTHGNQYSAQPNPDSGINYQALLDSLSHTNNGPVDRNATPMPAQTTSSQSHAPPTSTLPAAPNLPARPPAQDKLATNSNYNPEADIRSYHPHSQKQSNAQTRGHVQLQPLNMRGVGGNSPGDNLSSAKSNPSPITPGYKGYNEQQAIMARSETPDDEDTRWPPEINRLYDEFLEDERKFVTDGQWDQFPMGSRLFIGNLPTEKVTKRDIFHRFFRHGKLAQISIKQAYGFVQFLDTPSCHKALQAEQGQAVRGRKMHLEISKPQRNTKKAGEGNTNEKASSARRRSRSPDYIRGGNVGPPRNDRYAGSQPAMSPRDRDNRRFRDDYRPMRSPSPPRRGSIRGRDRSRDRYDGRRRSRSRSLRRFRSPTPPRREFEDDLPLPHRAPGQVPDVQVLVVNEGLPRDFIHWVEDTFRQQGLRIDVLILSPRLSEGAVIKRQIVEGVLAIVKLNAASVATSKISLQVFDRRGGIGNVQFNEYADLDPSTAAALVNNAKMTASQPVQPPAQPTATYGYNNYGVLPAVATPYANAPPPTNPYAPPQPNPPAQDLSSLISSLDSNGLSRLLGAMGQGQNIVAQNNQPPPAGLTADLARLLGSVSTPVQAPAYAPTAQPTYHNSYQNQNPNAAFAQLLGGQQHQQHQPHQPHQVAPPVQQTPAQSGQPDMNEIMAQLAKYQR